MTGIIRNVCLLVLFCNCCAFAEPATKPARAKVVCFGDSITKIGYGGVLGKQVDADVVNAGKSGETSAGGLKRLERDVLAEKPDIVVVLYGTNDMVMNEPAPKVSIDQYKANLNTIIDRVQANGAKVVLCTVPPINATPYFTRHPQANYDKVGGLPAVIEQYRKAAMSVADDKHVPLIDLNTLLAERPEWQGPDGVHPSKEGRVIIAQIIAKALRPMLEAMPAH